MDRDEAIRVLWKNTDPDDNNDDDELGLLASLRPYRGVRRRSLDQIREAVAVLAAEISGPTLDREVMDYLWAILFFTQAWALDDGGMLKRNGLIAHDDAERLGNWLFDFGLEVHLLLEGGRS
jgi:hypothetical protein